jgi:hypothetical protein
MNWLKKKLFNWAAESVGEIEDAIHHPSLWDPAITPPMSITAI